MSKKLLSTILLFAIGVGFAIWDISLFTHIKSSDDLIEAVLYAIPTVAAFAALIALPFRQAP